MNLSWTTTTTSTFPGVTSGDPVTFTLLGDNSGSDTLNQTWTAANFLSFSVDINNGAYTANYLESPGFSGIGSFTTDGAGNVTGTPAAWFDNNATNYTDSFSNNDPGGWFINGQQNVSDAAGNQSLTVTVAGAVGESLVAGNWNAQVVPEPSSIVLGLLGALGEAGLVWHRGRA